MGKTVLPNQLYSRKALGTSPFFGVDAMTLYEIECKTDEDSKILLDLMTKIIDGKAKPTFASRVRNITRITTKP